MATNDTASNKEQGDKTEINQGEGAATQAAAAVSSEANKETAAAVTGTEENDNERPVPLAYAEVPAEDPKEGKKSDGDIIDTTIPPALISMPVGSPEKMGIEAAAPAPRKAGEGEEAETSEEASATAITEASAPAAPAETGFVPAEGATADRPAPAPAETAESVAPTPEGAETSKPDAEASGDAGAASKAEEAATAGAAAAAAAATPKKRNKWLSFAFNAVASTAIGAAASVGAKALIVMIAGATFPASAAVVLPFLCIAAGAFASAYTVTGFTRLKDIYAFNKNAKSADERAGYLKDFFNYKKTGHNDSYYAKKRMTSLLFGLVGGGIMYGLGELFFPVSEAAPPVDGGEVVPPVDGGEVVPPVDGGEVVPPVDGGEVVPVPVIPAPAEHVVVRGDNLWNIVKDYYHLTSNAEIQQYTDAVGEFNNMTVGTAANNIDIGDKILLPSVEQLKADNILVLDWKALDAETARRLVLRHG